MSAPEFQIGEMVYYAEAYSCAEVEKPCPVCCGKLAVQIILGNGEIESIECEACAKGYGGPRGVVTEFAPTSRVGKGEITGVSKDNFNGGWCYSVSGSTGRNIFRTEEEAEARRAELYAECLAQDERRNDAIIADKKKGLAWAVRYHREKIRSAEKDLEYHCRKLGIVREKQAKKPARIAAIEAEEA
mgnify:CR=1 FL=1